MARFTAIDDDEEEYDVENNDGNCQFHHWIHQKNMGLETKILSLSILDAELCAKAKFHFTGGHFENGGI